MPRGRGIAAAARDLDEMIAEGAQHRLGDGIERDPERDAVEGGIELAADPLAKVAATLRRNGIRRFPGRDLGERSPIGDFTPELLHALQGGGAVRGSDHARNRDPAHVRSTIPLEFVAMFVEVGLDFRRREPDRRVGDDRAGKDRGELDTNLLVAVAILLPERGIGEVDVGRHERQEFAAQDLLAHLRAQRLDIGSRARRREPPLILREIELALGLEFGCRGELLRRAGAEQLHHFLLGGLDPVAAVLGVEHPLLDHLFPDPVPDRLEVLERQRCGGLPLGGFRLLLDDRLIGAGVDRLAVDRADGIRRAERAVIHAGEQEGHHEEGEEHHGDLLGKLAAEQLDHRSGRHSSAVRRDAPTGAKRAISLSGATGKVKRKRSEEC